jgi:hypothetical protein
MDTVTILRELWRRRLLVIGVALVAVFAGTALLYKISLPAKLESRRYQVGIATASILVDTPSSQVVDVSPKGSDTLGMRANLLASVMVDGVVKSEIAETAGLDPKTLVGISTSAQDQPATRPKDHRIPVLTTRVVTDNDGAELPIIGVEAQAPDSEQASKLASAAVVGLRNYLDSTAAAQKIPDAKRLNVSELGQPQSRIVTRGPTNLIGLAVVLFVFGLGCAAILAGVGLSRGWRAAAAAEERDRAGSDPSPDGVTALQVPPAAEDDDRRSPALPFLVATPSDDGPEDAGDEPRASSA